MPDPTPRVERKPAPEGSHLYLLGQWTASQLAQPRLLKQIRLALGASGADRGTSRSTHSVHSVFGRDVE